MTSYILFGLRFFSSSGSTLLYGLLSERWNNMVERKWPGKKRTKKNTFNFHWNLHFSPLTWCFWSWSVGSFTIRGYLENELRNFYVFECDVSKFSTRPNKGACLQKRIQDPTVQVCGAQRNKAPRTALRQLRAESIRRKRFSFSLRANNSLASFIIFIFICKSYVRTANVRIEWRTTLHFVFDYSFACWVWSRIDSGDKYWITNNAETIFESNREIYFVGSRYGRRIKGDDKKSCIKHSICCDFPRPTFTPRQIVGSEHSNVQSKTSIYIPLSTDNNNRSISMCLHFFFRHIYSFECNNHNPQSENAAQVQSIETISLFPHRCIA